MYLYRVKLCQNREILGNFCTACLSLLESLIEIVFEHSTVFLIEILKFLERMEREFHKQQYVVGHERMYLANALNLTEAQVKVWFQNRRIKWRKQHMLSEQTRLHTLTDHSAAHPVNPSHHHDPQDQLDQLN